MATLTFPLIDCSPATKKQHKPKVLRTRFKNGFSQSTRDGVNNAPEQWGVVWENITQAEMQEINSFLRDRGGGEKFYWTPPMEAIAKLYTCEDWSVQGGSDIWSVTATFLQEYLP